MSLLRCRNQRSPPRWAIKEIYNAEDIDKAQVAIKAFEIDYASRDAVCLRKDGHESENPRVDLK